MPRYNLIAPRRSAGHAINPKYPEAEQRYAAGHVSAQAAWSPITKLDIRAVVVVERCGSHDPVIAIDNAEGRYPWRKAGRVFVFGPCCYGLILAEEEARHCKCASHIGPSFRGDVPAVELKHDLLRRVSGIGLRRDLRHNRDVVTCSGQRNPVISIRSKLRPHELIPYGLIPFGLDDSRRLLSRKHRCVLKIDIDANAWDRDPSCRDE